MPLPSALSSYTFWLWNQPFKATRPAPEAPPEDTLKRDKAPFSLSARTARPSACFATSSATLAVSSEELCIISMFWSMSTVDFVVASMPEAISRLDSACSSTESPSDIPYRNSPDFCYTGVDEACIITKRGEGLGPKGKSHSANTKTKDGGESRHDDLLWKDLLARFFIPMLQSLLPDLAEDIDDKRDVVFLDKELRRLARFTRQYEGGEPDGNRFVDLLAQVPLLSGEEPWILLHTEVQGRGGNEDFPLRMHRYRGLLEGRYRHPVIALALLIEPLSKEQSSGVYRWEGYGTRVSYEFPVFKLYEGDEEALKASENPFDLAHLAGLRAWKSRGSEARKLDYLKEMLSLLEDRGWSHADKAQLLVFMEGVIHLTEDASSREYEEWESALEEAREAGRMYVSIMERKGIEKGRIEGIQLGRTEGIQLGRIEGIQLGRTETAQNLLRMGLDLPHIAEATGLPLEEIQTLKKTGGC